MHEERRAVWVAGGGDAADVGRLLHDFNTEFDVDSPGPEVLARRLSRLLGRDQVFAVLAGSPPAGVALVTLRPNVWYEGLVATLDELYVVPARRGLGIGTDLMERVVEVALAREVEAIEINVDEGDVDAQRFYQRLGFSSIEPDTGERALYLFRELD